MYANGDNNNNNNNDMHQPKQPSEAEMLRFIKDLQQMSDLLKTMDPDMDRTPFHVAMAKRALELGFAGDIPEHARYFLPQHQLPRPQVSFLPQLHPWLRGEDASGPEPTCTCPICYAELDIKGISPLVSGEFGKSSRSYYCGHIVCDDCHNNILDNPPHADHDDEDDGLFRCPVCRQSSQALVCQHPITTTLPTHDADWDVLDVTGVFKSFCQDCLHDEDGEPIPHLIAVAFEIDNGDRLPEGTWDNFPPLV